jgi:hypothetical protein
VVAYEVTVTVAPALDETFRSYMVDDHLPAILGTGCFTAIRFERQGPGCYRSRYEAASRLDLDRYLDAHTAAFRADFVARFPEGCRVQREVWEELRVFGRPAG